MEGPAVALAKLGELGEVGGGAAHGVLASGSLYPFIIYAPRRPP
jgi:hypothetical protein